MLQLHEPMPTRKDASPRRPFYRPVRSPEDTEDSWFSSSSSDEHYDDREQDELMDIIEDSNISPLQRTSIEARLVALAHADYLASKDSWSSRPHSLPVLSDAFLDDDPEIQIALLEEARQQHTLEADRALDKCLDRSPAFNLLPDDFDEGVLLPAPVSGLAEELGEFDLGGDWMFNISLGKPVEDPFLAGPNNFNRKKRRKTEFGISCATKANAKPTSTLSGFQKQCYLETTVPLSASTPLTPPSAPPLAPPLTLAAAPTGPWNKRKHRRAHSAGEAEVAMRLMAGAEFRQKPQAARSKTPPLDPSNGIKQRDRTSDGRVIIRRGPRGKYLCQKCGAARAGHTCDVKMARSVHCQVDLKITAANIAVARQPGGGNNNYSFNIFAPITGAAPKIIHARTWIGTDVASSKP